MTEDGAAAGFTARLARTIADDESPAGDDWLDLGERAFVDTVGVLSAGRDDPAVAALAGTVLAEEAGGSARSLAVGRGLPARTAALLDATSAHALDDDDDVDDALIGHPSTVLVPALLAPGDAGDAAGEEVLEAFRRGLEAGRTVAGAMGIGAHYQAGWHATSTVGTPAAAGGRPAGPNSSATSRRWASTPGPSSTGWA
jgi:2-methylcitrate dehydratase PrpD